MKTLIIILMIIPLMSFSQRKTFKYSDTTFEVGAVHRFNIDWSYNRHGIIEGELVIDTISEFLKEHPKLIVEIGVHTDYRGSATYNQRLSERRAMVIVDLILQQGIDSSQISYKGYGESDPIIPEDDIKKECFPEKVESAHQTNRRSEIKIIAIEPDVEFKLTDTNFRVGQEYVWAGFSNNNSHFHSSFYNRNKSRLDSIINFFNINDTLVVEIGSHTIYHGSSEFNLISSSRLAKSFINVLMEHGLKNFELISKGYGESQPIISEKKLKEIDDLDERLKKAITTNGRIVLKIIAIKP